MGKKKTLLDGATRRSSRIEEIASDAYDVIEMACEQYIPGSAAEERIKLAAIWGIFLLFPVYVILLSFFRDATWVKLVFFFHFLTVTLAPYLCSRRFARRDLEFLRRHSFEICTGCRYPLMKKEDGSLHCSECGENFDRAEVRQAWRSWIRLKVDRKERKKRRKRRRSG